MDFLPLLRALLSKYDDFLFKDMRKLWILSHVKYSTLTVNDEKINDLIWDSFTLVIFFISTNIFFNFAPFKVLFTFQTYNSW